MDAIIDARLREQMNRIGIREHDLPITRDELRRKLHDRHFTQDERDELRNALGKIGGLE